MSRLFIPNFSFESARHSGQTASQAILRLEAEMAPVWMAVADENDEIFCPIPIDETFWKSLEDQGLPRIRPISPHELSESQADQWVPWGWTPQWRQQASKQGISVNAPSQELIWQANSREFSYGLEKQLNLLPEGSRLIKHFDDLAEQLARKTSELKSGWIVKSNFSHAGRGHLRGVGAELSSTQASQVKRLLQTDGAVVLEPLLSIISEIGCQWEITDSVCQLIATTQLLSTAQGGYYGTDTECHVPDKQLLFIHEMQRRVVEQLQILGYRGPVGIDAVVYQASDGERSRPLQDINARWTMGRLAWELAGKFHPGQKRSGRWIHSVDSPAPDAIPLSPEKIDGTLVRFRTWWLG